MKRHGRFLRAPSIAKHGDLQFRSDAIYVVDDEGDAACLASPILVTAFATSDPNTPRETAFTVVKFLNRLERWRTEIIPASLLTARPHEFIELLTRRGYSWLPNTKIRLQIISALSVVKPSRHIRLTSVPGPCGKLFVLPGQNYGPSGSNTKSVQIVNTPTVGLGRFRRAGSLDDWKTFVANQCVHSTRARLAVASNFAAPNLRKLGLSSFGFNFSGLTSTGKTLLVRWATSASGLNSGAGPTTWDGTLAAFEQRALGHRDCIMSLDDLSYLDDPQKVAKLVTFRLAGNRAKEKAGQYVAAQNLIEDDYRVIALSTSEHPLWEQLDPSGRSRIRGEQVRMINVRAGVSDMQDIFDAEDAHNSVGNTVQERSRYVEKQERRAIRYQGEAFRAYLTTWAKDKGGKSILKNYMADYIREAPLPDQQRWLARIQRHFAVVYASAAQAIDYGVLPWAKIKTLKAIRSCMLDAMDQLIANSAEVSERAAIAHRTDESLLAEFKQRVTDAKFVHMVRNRRKVKTPKKQLANADGITRTTKLGKRECLLFGRTLEAWFPETVSRHQLTKLLRSRRIMKEGRRPDTSTRQVLIAELGRKVSCYGLIRNRLRNSTAKSQ
jgi:putative DNA primase/helicase